MDEGGDAPLRQGEQGVESPISGNLWQVQTAAGSRVRAGDVLGVLESVEMEIPLLLFAGPLRRHYPAGSRAAGQRGARRAAGGGDY